MYDEHDDSYTYPTANEGAVIQWELMADDGLISHETAARLAAADTEFAKANLARRRPSRMSEVNRLRFVRTLSLHGLTEADLAAVVTTPRPNRGFAQRMSD